MNILACDIGLKRIGLAIYEDGIILPLLPIMRINRNQAAKELDNLLLKRNISKCVVGLPSGGQSERVEMKKRIIHFVSLLQFSGEVYFVDEDYSSMEALESLKYMGRKKRARAKKDGKLDSLSACIILERFNELNKNSC